MKSRAALPGAPAADLAHLCDARPGPGDDTGTPAAGCPRWPACVAATLPPSRHYRARHLANADRHG